MPSQGQSWLTQCSGPQAPKRCCATHWWSAERWLVTALTVPPHFPLFLQAVRLFIAKKVLATRKSSWEQGRASVAATGHWSQGEYFHCLQVTLVQVHAQKRNGNRKDLGEPTCQWEWSCQSPAGETSRGEGNKVSGNLHRGRRGEGSKHRGGGGGDTEGKEWGNKEQK